MQKQPTETVTTRCHVYIYLIKVKSYLNYINNVISHPPSQAIIPKPKNPNSKEHPAETTPEGRKFLEGATLQKPTGVELIRGWEDWKLAFVPKSGCTPRTVPIGYPMGNSVPKTRRVITEEIKKLA
jgi:hypothetical protein